jgi:ParB-like nuclease family protein
MVDILKKVINITADKLLFDLHNPRLALELADQEGNEPTDIETIQYLDEEADLQEIITSILQNGFIPVEPLIVIAAEDNNYKVLEGNRRLAAIKLILDDKLQKDSGITIDQNRITQEVIDTIQEIPVYVVDKVEEARSLIGFKHIKGPYKWNSFAKAKYVTAQYRQGLSIEQISKAIGDENYTVRDLICGMLVLEQAINYNLFSISDRNKSGLFGFSHLYTALGRSEYQDFLGLETGWNKKPAFEPVPQNHHDMLKEVLHYIYGSKKEDKPSLIRSQNPDLKHLGETIACSEGLAQLRAGVNLEVAYEELLPDDIVFNSAIRKALSAINHALATVSKYDGKEEDALSVAQKILRGAESIEATVKLRHKKYSKELEG